MTHELSSAKSGGCRGFTVRTVYTCDICGVEVDDHDKIIEHVADHDSNVLSANDTEQVDISPVQQQQDVSSSSVVHLAPKRRRTAKSLKMKPTDCEVISQSTDSKPLICNDCGQTYKYLRCFERHKEQCSSSNTNEKKLQCKASTVSRALPSESDNANSTNYPQQPQYSSSSNSVDNPLGNSDRIELHEVTDILHEVFKSVSDKKGSSVKEVRAQRAVYCCPECPKQFHSRRAFYSHTAHNHTDCGWNLLCKWCGRLFQEADKLRYHIVQQHSEIVDFIELALADTVNNPHRCKTCGCCYRDEKALMTHIESHDSCMPAFACSMCSGRYVSRSGLNCHIQRMHSSESPYPCELCGDSFATAEQRCEHAKQHAADLCTVCSIRLRRTTSSGEDTEVTTCTVCYLEQLSSSNGVQIAEDSTEQQSRVGTCNSQLPLKFPCATCGIKFSWRSNLIRHQRKHASNNSMLNIATNLDTRHFQCSYCSRVFNQTSSLRKHMLHHVGQCASESVKFSCKLCGQRFSWKRSLVRHLRNAHPTSSAQLLPVVAPSADVSKEAMPDAGSTMSEVETVSSKVCDLCSQQCESSSTLNAHLRLHHSDAIDPSMNKSTSSKNKSLVPCPECDAVFFWESNVRRHIREQHQGHDGLHQSVEDRRLKCTKCGRCFARLSYLRVHLQAHIKAERSGGRLDPLLCSECGLTLSNARQLHFHMLRHSGIRPHKCDQCNKSFYAPAQLNAHVSVVHNGHRFVCDQCGHKANSKTALKCHSRSAHPTPGVEPTFPCPLCSRRYWTPAALRRHAEAHNPSRSDQRKAMCAICSMLFRHAYNLSHHIQTTHVNDDCVAPFACATCKQQFATRLEFKTHYRSKHRKR